MKDVESYSELTEVDKGILMWEEQETFVDKRRNYFFIIGLSWMVIWSIGLLIFWFLQVSGIIVAMVLIPMGFIFFYRAFTLLPHKIYENGVEYGSKFPPLLFESRTFISWGEIKGFVEIKKEYIFECPNGRNIGISKNSSVGPEIVKKVKDRIGKEEYLIPVGLKARMRRAKKMELLVYPVTFIISLIIYFPLTTFYFGPQTVERVGVALFWMSVPAFSILFTVFWLYTISSKRKKQKCKMKLDLRALAIFFVLMSIIYYSNFNIEAAMQIDDPPEFNYRLHSTRPLGGYLKDISGFYNKTYELNKSLYIISGSDFEIINSNITLIDNWMGMIYVGRNSTLWIENSTIAYENPSPIFNFEVSGNLFVYNSTIRYVWGNTERKNLEGGIELHGANAVFENSIIEDCRTNGIITNNSNLLVKSCLFENCEDDAIELHHTKAKIENCTFRNNGWTVMFWQNSDALVTNCTFEDNIKGMWIYYSSPTIKNNVFRNTTDGPAIKIHEWYSKPVLSQNKFQGNKADIIKPEIDPPSYYYLTFGLPVLGISSLIFFYLINGNIMRDKKIVK